MRPVLDLQAISDVLYLRARKHLIDDYGITESIESSAALQEAVLRAMDQRPLPETLQSGYKPTGVFRAAVRSIGSNSRKWVFFLRAEPRIRLLIGNYDEVAAASAIDGDRLCAEDLAALLPGPTGRADSRAILSWARMLVENDYSSHFLDCRDKVLGNASDADLTDCEISALLACLLSKDGSRLKTPGMGPTLASEFLRNLGFSMFKPDRHIRRLLGRWAPEVVESFNSRAIELQAKFVGGRGRDVRDFIQYSIACEQVTPDGVDYSRADNLVWALAYYVEKKNRESNTCYLIRR